VVRIAFGIATVVVALLAVIWVFQRRLIYFPFGQVADPQTIGLDHVAPVILRTSDELALNGWFISPTETPDYTVIVFNGNAGNRALRAPLARALARHRLAVLLFDYRGFGGNPGTPTEYGLRLDARAARDFVVRRNAGRFVYFGESLGSAVATELALEYPPAALILRSPFTSMADVGRVHYPLLPVRWLLRDRFATIDHIAAVRAPLLIIAGDRDSIVPLPQSRQVHAAAREPKSLLVIRNGDHNDDSLLFGREMIEGIVHFLRTLPDTKG
jgi:fermentation-respiration switch protein FrsA (DUF1100 family)